MEMEFMVEMEFSFYKNGAHLIDLQCGHLMAFTIDAVDVNTVATTVERLLTGLDGSSPLKIYSPTRWLDRLAAVNYLTAPGAWDRVSVSTYDYTREEIEEANRIAYVKRVCAEFAIPKHPNDYLMVGYTGNPSLSSGFCYAPYIPLISVGLSIKGSP